MKLSKQLAVILTFCLVVTCTWGCQGKDEEVSTEDVLASLEVALTKGAYVGKLLKQAADEEKQAPANAAKAKKIIDVFVSDYGIDPQKIKTWGYYESNVEFSHQDLTVSLIRINVKDSYLVYNYTSLDKDFKWVNIGGTPQEIADATMRSIEMPLEKHLKSRIEPRRIINN